MAIDPMLYEKVSGRSGDPYSRLGAALAGADAAKSKRTTEKERSYMEASLIARFKYQAIAGAVIAVILLIGWIAHKVFRMNASRQSQSANRRTGWARSAGAAVLVSYAPASVKVRMLA